LLNPAGYTPLSQSAEVAESIIGDAGRRNQRLRPKPRRCHDDLARSSVLVPTSPSGRPAAGLTFFSGSDPKDQPIDWSPVSVQIERARAIISIRYTVRRLLDFVSIAQSYYDYEIDIGARSGS